MVAAILGAPALPSWAYGAAFSAALVITTWIALALDGQGLAFLGLMPTRRRVGEFTLGLGLSTSLFAVRTLSRDAFVGASWTFVGWRVLSEAIAGLGIALLLLLPKKLL